MYKSLFNLRNFKKGLRLIDNITRQNTTRAVDYFHGYAVASVKEAAKRGRITHNQEKALCDLADEAAADTTAEIREDEDEAETDTLDDDVF